MGVKVTNNAYATISTGIDSSATTVTVDSGQGARFPTLGAGDYFYATLIDTSNNLEVVKVTARSTDSMTVVRGADNTTARAFSIGDRFELRPTAALFESIIDEATLADGDYGDITVSSSGSTFTIDNGVVTAAKLASSLDLTGKTVTLPANTGGKVLQVTTTVRTTAADSSGTSWTDIFSVSITPSATSSKVFLLCNPGSLYPGIGGNSGDYYSCRIVRNGSTLSGMNTNFHAEMGRGENFGVRQYPVITFLDSPSSTSALTYTLQFQRTTGSGALRINDTAGTSVFTAFEIAG